MRKRMKENDILDLEKKTTKVNAKKKAVKKMTKRVKKNMRNMILVRKTVKTKNWTKRSKRRTNRSNQDTNQSTLHKSPGTRENQWRESTENANRISRTYLRPTWTPSTSTRWSTADTNSTKSFFNLLSAITINAPQ